jgi:hypothetical protein
MKTNMNKQQKLFRLTCVALIMAFGMLMPACGGGGSSGGGGVTRPLVASFAPDNPNPVADTISMAGATTGANVAVSIQVTEIDAFFGAGFRVTYDSASVNFVGFDPASFLDNHAGGTDIDAREEDPNNRGTVVVTATIQDAGQPAGLDVAGTQTLITLNFQATASTPQNLIEFASPWDVQICAAQGQACNEVSGQLDWDGGRISATR